MPPEQQRQLKLAMVTQTKAGRWEVRVASVESETNSQEWRHHSYHPSEAAAEQAARDLLPQCDAAWHPQAVLPPGKLATKAPWHLPRKPAAQPKGQM